MKLHRLIAGSVLSALVLSIAQPVRAESQSGSPADMEWFREARFGMFIHWGLYSEPAGEWKGQKTGFGAEWIQERFGVPYSEYRPLADKWDPRKYKPREWVKLMKASGVRYICITSKHHDGFCLWPTETNDDWNIGITPYKKDLLKPLAEACREEGVVFCLYHSVMDWNHPDWTGQSFNDLREGTPDKERFKKEYLYPQLKELFTNYGEIGMLWLDGTWDKAWTSEDGKELEEYIRTLQPNVVLNNRSGYKPPQPKYDFHIDNAYSYISAGDYISPENEVPPTGLPGIDWETCQTLQPPKNWGYNKTVGFQSFPDSLRQLVDVVSKGGNLLLNVGPHADGSLLPETIDRLERFAEWMEDNSESIHGTTASPFEKLLFNGRCTKRPGKLYLHVFDWPANQQLVLPMKNRIQRAYLLADSKEAELVVNRTDRGSAIALPKKAPDPVVSVVVVEIDEDKVEVLPPPKNLAESKPMQVSSTWPGRPALKKEHITDNNPGSMWAAEESARSGWVQVDLQKKHSVSGALLSDAPYHRTQQFELQAKVGGKWETLASGTTIGGNLALNFPEVTAQFFRLNILKTSDTPTLADFQLFGD